MSRSRPSPVRGPRLALALALLLAGAAGCLPGAVGPDLRLLSLSVTPIGPNRMTGATDLDVLFRFAARNPTDTALGMTPGTARMTLGDVPVPLCEARFPADGRLAAGREDEIAFRFHVDTSAIPEGLRDRLAGRDVPFRLEGTASIVHPSGTRLPARFSNRGTLRVGLLPRVAPAPGERLRVTVEGGVVGPGGDRSDRSAIDSLRGPFAFLLRMRWPGERAPEGLPEAPWVFTVVDRTQDPARVDVAHLGPDGSVRLVIPLVVRNPNGFPIGIPPMEIGADSTGETVWPATPVPRDGGGTTIEPGTSRRVDYVATLRFVDGEERFSPNTRRLVLRLMPDLGDGPVPVGIPAP